MKKIWLLCLCLACLSLAGCFHVPDEDWLPSRNKVNSEEVEKDVEFEQAVDSFMDWIIMISSDWNEIKNDEVNNEEFEDIIKTWDENIDIEETVANDEVVNNEETIDADGENQENTVE